MKAYTLLTIALLFLLGCKNNPLDIKPDGRVTLEDVFDDNQHTEAYLNTVYGYIPEHFYSYGNFEFLAGITDDAYDPHRSNPSSWNRGGLSPSNNNYNNYYSNYWAGIRHANVFLAHIDHAAVSNEKKRSRFKSEARVLRAFYYFEMIKQYGPMPVLDKALDPDFDFKTLKRPSFQDNVDFIVADCDAAINNPDLPLRWSAESEFGRFTKAVAYAIKSKALLFNASPLWNPENDPSKWDAAAKASKEAIDALTKDGIYQLTDMDDYESYFYSSSDGGDNPKDKETILQGYDSHNLTNFVNYFGIPSKSGVASSGINPTQELVDSYDMQSTGEAPILGYNDAEHLNPIINTSSGYDSEHPYKDRDPRFYATIWYNGAKYDNIDGNIHDMAIYLGGADEPTDDESNPVNTHSGYYLRKYVDPALQHSQPTSAKPKLLRLATIYLNLAEAENEAHGPTQTAYDAINTIRERAEMPDLPSGLTKDEFRWRVRQERRVEFPFEEKRFWDVRRWKILDSTYKLKTGMLITKDGNNFHYSRTVIERTEAWKDKYLIYPIPIGDVQDVPDFAENQNPGW